MTIGNVLQKHKARPNFCVIHPELHPVTVSGDGVSDSPRTKTKKKRSLARVPYKITATFSPSWLLFSPPPQRKWINIQSLSSNVEKNDVPCHSRSKAAEELEGRRIPTKRRTTTALLRPFFPLFPSFLLGGRRNDKTFLVFRRQASHSIFSNFIRERRRTRSYIGRKDISCSCRELRKVEEGVLWICQHSQQGVQHDILAQSISKPAE